MVATLPEHPKLNRLMTAMPSAYTWIAITIFMSSPTFACAGGYAVVISEGTHADEQWREVADTLLKKHDGQLVRYKAELNETRDQLRSLSPEQVCFVAQPHESGRRYVAQVHALCRNLDSDPYYDCLWGIVTGFDATDALRIAQRKEPLVIRRVGSGTEIALELCREGQWYCELEKGRHVAKQPDGKVKELDGPEDTTQALADLLTEYNADLFVTSGHATERNWQIGFRYKNGYFRSAAGQLYGRDTLGKEFAIRSDHPRVYLPIGNCLMGHIDGQDAMALAWIHSVGVHQMIGYTVPTWYGYAGWGMLDYFVEQPGRYTFAEAFYANQQALIHRLTNYFPEIAIEENEPGQMSGVQVTCGDAARLAGLSEMDGKGLLFDRDVVAFYGDPGWEARMENGQLRWNQTLQKEGNRYTFEIHPLKDDQSFETVNSNGAQRGGRPIVQRLPYPLSKIELISGQQHQPLIADDFILVPRPSEALDKPIRIVFDAFREPSE
ncbi:MAG: hypothetical protein ACR2NZ_23095 [Rubripirellula sp.]